MRSPDEEQEVEHAEETHTADDVAPADPQVGDSSEAEAAAVAGTEADPLEAAESAQAEDRGAHDRLVFHDLSKLSIPDASAKEVELEDSIAESPVLGLQAEADASVVSPGKANFVQSQEPSPELFERLAVSVDDEVALSAGHDPYEPRSKSVSPVQRKIREMEAEAWAGIPFDPKPTPTRLERDLGHSGFSRNEQSVSAGGRAAGRRSHSTSPVRSPSKSNQEELARLAAAPGPTPEALSEMLQKHKEKQQRMRDAAAARSPERSPQPNASSQALIEQQAEAWGGESLDAVIIPSKSRLEVEQQEWEAKKAAGLAEESRGSGGSGGAVAEAEAEAEVSLPPQAGQAAEEEQQEVEAEPSLVVEASEAGEEQWTEPEAAAAPAGGTAPATPAAVAQGAAEEVREQEEDAEEQEEGEEDYTFEGMSLEEIEAALAEAEAEAAMAEAAAATGSGNAGYVSAAGAFRGISLGGLLKHKSRLEKERDAALAAAAPRQAPKKTIPSPATGPGMGEDMIVHRSQLEQARDAALAAAAPRVNASRSRPASAHVGGGLDEMVVHKSQLEHARDAALAAAAPRVNASRSRTASAQAYEGPTLSEAFGTKKLSKLEQEQAAAKAAAAAGGGVADGPRKSKLQLENAAAAAAGKADRMKAMLEKAKAAKAAKAAASSAPAEVTPKSSPVKSPRWSPRIEQPAWVAPGSP